MTWLINGMLKRCVVFSVKLKAKDPQHQAYAQQDFNAHQI
jgi:hypothetical protein